MLGIQGLCGDDGRQLERSHNREIAQANKKMTPDMKIKRLDTFQLGLQAGNAIIEPNLAGALRYKFVRRIKEMFDGHLIRRTITSKLPDGQPISSLPPKNIHSLAIKLSEAEMKIVNNALAESTENSKKKTNFDFNLHVSHNSFTVWGDDTDALPRISSPRPGKP